MSRDNRAHRIAELFVAFQEPWPEVVAEFAVRARADAAVVLAFDPMPMWLGSFGVQPPSHDLKSADAMRKYLQGRGFTGSFVRELALRPGVSGAMCLATRGRSLPREWEELVEEAIDVLALGLGLTIEKEQCGREAAQRKQLESRLSEMEQVSSLGKIACAVAHDLSSPISAILIEGEEIKKGLDDLALILMEVEPTAFRIIDQLRELATHTVDTAERARRMISDFRVGQEGCGAEESVDVETALRSCVKLLAPLARKSARVELDVHSGLPLLVGHRYKLEQAFMNLVLNALQAAGRNDGKKGLVRISAVQTESEVVVDIIDNGPGVPPENREKIFDPFFTTKPPEVGTGLGLPITREIIQAHGGKVELVDAQDRGACFRVRLPRR